MKYLCFKFILITYGRTKVYRLMVVKWYRVRWRNQPEEALAKVLSQHSKSFWWVIWGCVKPPTVKPVRNMVKLASPDTVKRKYTPNYSFANDQVYVIGLRIFTKLKKKGIFWEVDAQIQLLLGEWTMSDKVALHCSWMILGGQVNFLQVWYNNNAVLPCFVQTMISCLYAQKTIVH